MYELPGLFQDYFKMNERKVKKALSRIAREMIPNADKLTLYSGEIRFEIGLKSV